MGNVSDAAALTFFERAHEAFEAAEQAASEVVSRDYRLGERRVRLRFAGNALVAAITPALAHLATPLDAGAPRLTIGLWDSASTGTRLPGPPWPMSDFGARREIRGYNDGRIRTAFDVGSGVLSLLDLEKNLALYWVRDAQQLPDYERAAPLLPILHWWMQAHGRQLAHGAAIGTPAYPPLLPWARAIPKRHEMQRTRAPKRGRERNICLTP